VRNGKQQLRSLLGFCGMHVCCMPSALSTSSREATDNCGSCAHHTSSAAYLIRLGFRVFTLPPHRCCRWALATAVRRSRRTTTRTAAAATTGSR
jgi:hypothetical protein